MTFSNPYPKATAFFTSRFSQLSAQLKRIDRARVQRYAYNIAVAVGVFFYCICLALYGGFRLCDRARKMWTRYEVTHKLEAAYNAIRTDIKPAPLSERVAEVKTAYSKFGDRIIAAAAKLQSDYHSVRSEFTGTTAELAAGNPLKTKGDE